MGPRWNPGEPDTVIGALERAVAAGPDRELLDFDGARSTYRDVDRLTNRLAHGLLELGVAPGDTVVTILDNNLDAVVAWLAINKICGVSVPLNTALRGEFIRHQVADAGAAIVICEAEYLNRLAAVADGLPDVRLILHRGEIDRVPRIPISIARFDEYRGADESSIDIKAAPADLACLIYTSGTTGPSKGCMISSNYMCNLARLKLRGGPATGDDVTYTPLPLFHMNAVVSGILSTILVGGRIALAPRFSVSSFWPHIERSGASIASILGSMATLIAQAQET
jgi:crotonobetaine/carnitine-CoA ligase